MEVGLGKDAIITTAGIDLLFSNKMTLQFQYRFETADDLELNAVIVHLKGTVKKVEVLEYQQRILADTDVQHGYFEIVDLGTTDDYAVSDEDLAEIGLKGEEVAAAKGHHRTYYYAESSRAYGIAKTLQALGDDHGFDTEVYRDWETMVRVMGMRALEGD